MTDAVLRPLRPRSAGPLPVRWLLCAIYCAIAAVPSWLMSSEKEFSRSGKLVGVGIWIAIYCVGVSTPYFDRRWRDLRYRVAALTVAGVRVLVSLSMIPLMGVVAGFSRLAGVDMMCGMISMNLVGKLGLPAGPGAITFLSTLLTTLTQGLLLNIVLYVLTAVLFGVCAIFIKRPRLPDDEANRGFEVLAPAADRGGERR